MVDTADEVKTNNTYWSLMVNKDGEDMMDTADEVRTYKTCWTLLMK